MKQFPKMTTLTLMEIEKYTPNSLSIGAILGLIEGGEIAIPEIQRPYSRQRAD